MYVSNEHKIKDLLSISDLNILSWIITTFFQALYYDVDIFVTEEDLFEEPLESDLNDEIFYFKKYKEIFVGT